MWMPLMQQQQLARDLDGSATVSVPGLVLSRTATDQTDSFFQNQFARIFRITPSVFERIRFLSGNAHAFFQRRPNPVTGRGICPEVKLLLALKQLAFGVSPVAFLDRFQMGETAGRDCLKCFCRVISSSEELRQQCL